MQKYENGRNRISASRLQHISQILQVPVAFFFEDASGVDGAAEVPSYVNEFLATADGLLLLRGDAVSAFARSGHAIASVCAAVGHNPPPALQ